MAKKIKIIIAEDHVLYRDGLKTMLSCHNDFDIIAEAENGGILIKLFEFHKPDIVLMDINMPIMDGITMVQLLRKDEKTSHIPIIILSGKATLEDKLIGLEVYLPLSMLPKLEGNKFYFHEVIGFEIEDKRLGVFGKIISINDSSAQPLFEVVNGSVEILVPMIDQFLVKIDRENKKVIMDLPEGLVEMYL